MMAKRVAKSIVLTCLVGGTATPLIGQTVITPLWSVGASRPIPPELLGVNTRAKVTGLWDNPADQANLKRMAVEHLRFPGGIVANYYDWTTGDVITPDEPHPHHTIDVENYRMAQLLTAYQTTGVEPVFVLNLVTSYRIAGYASALESQLAMLRHAQQIGLPVERIELGNELYSPIYDGQTYPLSEVNMRGFLDAADYYSTASNWATQIRDEFPAAKIALVDTVVRSSDVANLNRKYYWNRDLNTMDLLAFDALVRHDYSAAGLLDPQDVSGSMAEIQQQQWELFLAPNGPDRVIGTAFSYMDDIAHNTQHTDGIPTWITEFNLMDKVGPVARTWTHAFFSAAMLYNMFDDPSIELITSHSFNGHKFGAVFFEDNEFPYMRIDPGYSLATTPGDLSANGHFLAVVNGVLSSMTHLAPIHFNPVPLVGELDADVADHPALVGYLLQNDHDQRMLFTNFSSQELVLDLANMPGVLERALILTADPRRHILEGSEVSRTYTSLGNQLTLPAYSLAAILRPLASQGDFDSDGDIDAVDIDLLRIAINIGSADPIYDVNGGGLDDTDFNYQVQSIIGSAFGDADLNQQINFTDFVSLSTNFGSSGTGWAQGNFNLDNNTNFADFVILTNNYGIDLDSGGFAQETVPEPVSLVLLSLAVGFVVMRRSLTA